MKILSIETSCDETALSIVEASGGSTKPKFKILANNVASQVKLHAKYGGVFPMMAKREHSKNLVPLFIKTLEEARLAKKSTTAFSQKQVTDLELMLDREPELKKIFLKTIYKIKKPNIDLIAVTTGPGLEPTLWVGINFARALATLWGIPVIGVNHMEGHIFSVFPKSNKETFTIDTKLFPSISLLVSGGHTELVYIKNWLHYDIIGQTRDDAVGEAFDKVARLLGLPYPGGPMISRLAKEARDKKIVSTFTFPRPMIHSKDYDFSFSGLKTAVLYFIQGHSSNPNGRKKIIIPLKLKREIARAFEDAAVHVLVSKTLRAIQTYKAKSLIVGGGVAANQEIRKVLSELSPVPIYFPTRELSTDNSLMIAIAGYMQWQKKKKGVQLNTLIANGNLTL
ncbi:tRNA (adenosine(37)-N6)-threonylcarbamoyltransferase complex transferase subunit TsaD [Candidatus Nomurabacteria bacterium]|nr:MAG: tRNA (adenosine(37)-N6)-threonylcarbamoyltransferase complex transferase subunit TsaD [Candidatus Nomurabacteria bacterium]